MGYVRHEPEEHICMECGDIIDYGRVDRKFCSDRCKNKYHNDIMHHQRAVQMQVLKSLSKNYRILERLISNGLRNADLSDLVQLGFNKEYATSYQKIGGRNEYWCFDIKYCMTPTRVCKIQRVEIVYQSIPL